MTAPLFAPPPPPPPPPPMHIFCPRIVLFLNWCHHKSCSSIFALFSLSHCLYCLYVINLYNYSMQVHVPNFKTQIKVKFCLSPWILCGKVASHTSPLFHVSQTSHHVLMVHFRHSMCWRWGRCGFIKILYMYNYMTTKNVVVMVTTPSLPLCMQVNGTSVYMTLFI